MGRVGLYSLALIVGMVLSQTLDMTPWATPLKGISLTLLGYIMIGVGLEFSLDKGNLKGYGKDYLVAMTAATFPWIFCSLYFWWSFDLELSKAALIGRFAAPTSAGVLFAMLSAAGLSATWVFKKARILAIFDDLDTILLIIPLQMIHLGFDIRAILLITLLFALLALAWFFFRALPFRTTPPYLLLYALFITMGAELFEKATWMSLEVLLPAFVLGCLLKPKKGEPMQGFDEGLKLSYMLLVGLALPHLNFTTLSLTQLSWHLLIITCLANLGKLYPLLCYKREVGFYSRAALGVALWPRGEVGAGILLISAGYAIPPVVMQVAGMSLALNLLLTGFFITLVIYLLKKEGNRL